MYRAFQQSVGLYRVGKLWHLRPWTRHGLVLMVSGLGYISIGVSYIVSYPSETRQLALEYAINWFPLWVWGIWFCITGAVAMMSARWPPVNRIWGYELLTGLAVAWSLFYAVGMIFGSSPASNASSAALWGIFGFLWWAISGLVDPEHGPI